MINILSKLEEILDVQPQEIHFDKKNKKNEILSTLSDALDAKKTGEEQLIDSLKKNEQTLLNAKKSKKINSKMSEQIYINDMKKKYGLESKIKRYDNLTKGDLLILSVDDNTQPDIFVIFEKLLDDDYFVATPLDDSGQLGSEVSSMYDQKNLQGLFEDSADFIVGLDEMINVFHSSLIKGYAGKIKDVSNNRLFNYYEQKPMTEINKINDKRVNARVEFFKIVNFYSEYKNKNKKIDPIEYIKYE